jgi:preprotein translocase subunit SecG
MYGFLLTVLVLDGIFMSIVILLQSGKGGGLAAVGGGSAMTEGILGGRQATTMLTRSTWMSGTIFMVLALVLSIMSSRAQAPQSVIQVPTPAGQVAPEPVIPGLGGDPVAPAPVEAPATQPPAN